MSIHAVSEKRTMITRDGQRVEYTTEIDPHRYLPIFLAMDGWLQEVTLDGAINIWWRAQKRKRDKEMHNAQVEAGR